jgi:hypothetical protein
MTRLADTFKRRPTSRGASSFIMVSPPLNASVEDWAKIRQPRFFDQRIISVVAALEGDAGFEKKCEGGGEISPGEHSATDH